ncbi:MAG: hypothetical protein CMC37_02680 [Flavobacteriaceae bacterium]|nr:hypothetical protein [Flavobacteriaceae bacterium]|tara:strand:+ start:6928 stop:7917 length:990 start_codon:yes stop_codon:yes gene_type:complete
MTNERKNNTQEEIDILVLFNKIKTLFLQSILFFFRTIKEISLAWKKLAALIAIGAALGYAAENITEKEPAKEASILLRINFDAGNYVYDAISLINQKIEAEDEDFFTNDMKFNEDEVLKEISIKPIIDLKDILKDEINANEIRTLFENLEFEDNLAMTEGFRSDYEYHILDLNISSSASNSSLKKIIDYFNTNPLFIGLKERRLQSISNTIFNNEQTINQIDKLIEKYSSADNFEKSTSQLYIDNKTYLPNELIKIKITLEEQNEELKGERILSTETVMVVNDTSLLIEKKGLRDNKVIYYPTLLVLAFILGGVILKLYRYLDELDRRM